MGQVWEVVHRSSGRPLAMKMLTRAYARRPEFQERFLREVEAAARLNHPNVVRVIDYGFLPAEADGVPGLASNCPYFVMEKADKPLEPKEITTFEQVTETLFAILAGLAHSHALGVIHRDIKPDNIIRFENGRIALADFGISHGLERHAPTEESKHTGRNTEEATGTPRYMSPEQIMGHWRDYGPWTDLYSVGIMAYLLVCGVAPFGGQNLFQIANHHLNTRFPALKPVIAVPDGFEAWVRRLTEKQHGDRYHSAAAASEALAEIVGEPSLVRTMDRLPYGLGLFGLRRLPSVGREIEKRDLQASADLALAGETQVLVIRGKRGLGASRLADWLAETLAETENVQSYRAADAGDPLSWLVSRRYRCVGMSAKACRDRIQTFAPDANPDELEALAGLASQTASRPDQRVSIALTPAQRQELVRKVLARDAVKRPVVVTLHSADLACEGLALSALDEFAGSVLFILTARKKLAIEDDERVRVVELKPLPPEAMAELVRNELGIPPVIAAQVESLAAGYPVWATELVEQWRDAGSLTLGEDGIHTLKDAQVPSELSRLFEGRLMRFVLRSARDFAPDQGALALAICAALGERWDPTEFEAAWALSEHPTLEAFDAQLLRSGMAKAEGSWRRWHHPLMRATIQNEACKQEQWTIANGLVARMLANQYHSDHPQLARRLARHLLDAGNPAAASLALNEALESARQRLSASEFGELGELLERALDARGVSHGGSHRAIAKAHRAVTLVSSMRSDDLLEGQSLLETALQIVETRGTPETRAIVLAIAGWATVHLRDSERGAQLLETALAIPGISDNTRHLTLVFLASRYSHAHQWDEMRRCATEVLAHSDVPAWKLRAEETLIHRALTTNHLEEAKTRIQNALLLAQETGQPHLRAHLHNLMGFAADASGDFAQAEAEHRKAVLLTEIFSPRSGNHIASQEYAARAVIQQGRFQDAQLELLELSARIDAGARGLFAHPWDARLACAAGTQDWDLYDEVYEKAVSFEGLRPNTLHGRTLTTALACLDSQNQAERANTLRARMREFFADDDDLKQFLPD